jgi:hypothetical protein
MITKAREKLRKLTNVMAGLGVATHLRNVLAECP